MKSAKYRPLVGRHLLLATDRSHDIQDLVDILQILGRVDVIAVCDVPEVPPLNLSGVVVDIDLETGLSAQDFGRHLLGEAYKSVPRLFVLSARGHHARMQAWALGATDTISRPFDAGSILQRILSAFPDKIDLDVGDDDTAALDLGVQAAHLVMVKIFERIPQGVPLVLEDLADAEILIMRAIKRTSLKRWLSAVSQHHQRSYRHCLIVTGLAVAFAQHLGVREDDQRRVTRAALIHDVGMAFVPKSILNKTEDLDAAESCEMQKHARLGYDAMVRQSGLPREVRDVVLHHHEWLDGTGYPDGLRGDQISDMVRLISIVETYAALTHSSSVASMFNYTRALDVMEKMDGKLDQALLFAFRPVVLGQ